MADSVSAGAELDEAPGAAAPPPASIEPSTATAELAAPPASIEPGIATAEVPPPGPADSVAALPEPDFVYALGRIEPRYPSLGLEKEVAQVAARLDTAGLTEREVLSLVLEQADNRYLVRQMCWVFLVEELETYILAPRDLQDLSLPVDAYRPEPSGDDLDAVIGIRGPIAPPEACNGVSVPIVMFDQLYSFHRDDLLQAIPRPAGLADKDDKKFRAAAASVFDSILHISDNAGATDDHRALNYLAVRYPQIYAAAAEAHERSASLSRVEVLRSPVSSSRTIMDVIFSFTDRRTDVVDKQFVRVDVSEEFPFLVTKLSPYFDR